jgi:hypothetical protein
MPVVAGVCLAAMYIAVLFTDRLVPAAWRPTQPSSFSFSCPVGYSDLSSGRPTTRVATAQVECRLIGDQVCTEVQLRVELTDTAGTGMVEGTTLTREGAEQESYAQVLAAFRRSNPDFVPVAPRAIHSPGAWTREVFPDRSFAAVCMRARRGILLTWPIAATLLLGCGALAALSIRKKHQRAAHGGCPYCGHDRAGLAADAPCPECGAVP